MFTCIRSISKAQKMQFPVFAPTRFEESSETLWFSRSSDGEETGLSRYLCVIHCFEFLWDKGFTLFFPACYLRIV